MGNWTKVSDGLIITQFYDVGTSFSDQQIGGGTQDNATLRTVGGLTWDRMLGGDGGYFIVDPADPYIIYAEYQGGIFRKSTNGGASFSPANSGFPGGLFVTPLVLDPSSPPEPNRILFSGGWYYPDPNPNGTFYNVYRTTDSAASWSICSPDLDSGVNSIAVAPAPSASVCAGTQGGAVWRSFNTGAVGSWQDITSGNTGATVQLPQRTVMDIVIVLDPSGQEVVYVTFSGFDSNTPTTPGHVFRGKSLLSSSAGAWTLWQWDNISGNLPDTPVNAIAVDQFSPNTLYAGTDIGVFRTTNGGLLWMPFDDGLPNVVIADLALNTAGDTLRAATYGRGMYERRLALICKTVDVYIRDNKLDTGKTVPSPDGVPDPTAVGQNVFWWESPDIKVDAPPYYTVDTLFDGVEFDHAPFENVVNDLVNPTPNLLYVQVHNRGPEPTHNVKVKVLYLDAAAAAPLLPPDFWTNYPNDWTPTPLSDWKTVDLAVPFQNIPQLLPHTPQVLKWDWIADPGSSAHVCVLAVISSDEDPVTRSDANYPNDHTTWMITPNDKHIAQRNLNIVTIPGPSPVAVTFLDFHNPFPSPRHFDIVFDLNTLPKRSRLSILLPEIQTQVPLTQKLSSGVEISKVTGNESWWGKIRGISKKGWQYHGQMERGANDILASRKLPHVPNILIPGSGKVRAALIISVMPKAKPGSSHRFTVMQRQGDTIIGGCTYEIRTPPTELMVSSATKAKISEPESGRNIGTRQKSKGKRLRKGISSFESGT